MAEVQQVAITGPNGKEARGDRALNHPVIIGVVLHSSQAYSSSDTLHRMTMNSMR